MHDDNPLLRPAFPVAFDRIRPEHVEPAVERLLLQARARLEQVVAPATPRDFQTLLALDAVGEPLSYALRIVGHLESVDTSEPLRQAHNATLPRVSAFLSGLWLHEGLWRAVEDYATTQQAQALRGPRRRLLDKTRDEFRRQGAALGADDKARLGAIDARLSELALRFGQNAVDATARWELVLEDAGALAGLPQAAVEAAHQSAARKGLTGYRLTLQLPSYLPAMTYLDDRALRRRLYLAAGTRATSEPHDNRPVLGEMLALRREKAKLLGYTSFADYVTEDRMARSGAAVKRFLDDLETRTRPHFERETAELMAFRRELEGVDAPPLEAWDISYYAEKLRQQRYDFDEEALRAYFSFERVLDGLFTVVERLHGLRVRPWQGAPSFHADARGYELVDETGAAVASFYVDPYPRDEKQGGAWVNGLTSHAALDAADMRHLGVLVANLTPPVGDRPARLGHQEVRTLFHELGHMLHHCLSRTEIRAQAGTQVAWDFVELPSQIMENFCYEPEVLALFARHEDTGAPLPPAIVERMRAARVFRAASTQMRQLGLAAVDLALHGDFDAARDGDPVAHARGVFARFSPCPLPPDHALIASFDHLFGAPVGYAAGYYAYKWAEVLEADAFREFRRLGLLSRAAGTRFRDAILARGDEDDPAELFRAFAGRDPDLGALLERLGLDDVPVRTPS